MLPRAYRLPSNIRLGRTTRFSTTPFLLKMVPNNLSHSRFGVVVSKRIDKRAVERNRIRRIFQRSFMETLPHLTGGYDILCIASPASKEVEASQVRETLVSLLQKHGIYK